MNSSIYRLLDGVPDGILKGSSMRIGRDEPDGRALVADRLLRSEWATYPDNLRLKLLMANKELLVAGYGLNQEQ
jgi:hypothetical protein